MHRDSAKNTLISSGMRQSTNNHRGTGVISNLIAINESRSNIKESNNGLTFKTMNENTWEVGSKKDNLIRVSVFTNEQSSPNNRFNRKQKVLNLIGSNQQKPEEEEKHLGFPNYKKHM
jgi:hypothetical protein